MKRSLKKLLSFTLSIIMILGVFSAGFSSKGILSIKAYAVGNYGVNLNSASYTSSNPFSYGQCTWYAWGRANEKLGINIPCRGNATSWGYSAGSYTIDNTPSSDSIAVWQYDSIGHVAYVENYNASENKIYISEGNANGCTYSEGNINLANGNFVGTFGWVSTWRGRGNPDKYIHLRPSDTTPPSITDVKVSNITLTGYTVTCKVSDNVGVTRVSFPTWTINNGQDDLLWKDGTLSGNTATFQVKISDHKNETGEYITHIYAYDAAGNSKSAGAPVTYVGDKTIPTGSITSTNYLQSYQTVTLTMSDNIGLAGYYWGTNSSYLSNSYTSISGKSKSVTKTVSSSGTYYLTVKDTAGNILANVSKTFYETTFDANGGSSGSISSVSVITMSGNAVSFPIVTRPGYNCTSWNTISNGTGTSYSGLYRPVGNKTLYAQWKVDLKTLSYNANGGTGAPPPELTSSDTIKISEKVPTRIGYVFLGWSQSKNATTIIYKPGETAKIVENATLYAVWQAVSVTIENYTSERTEDYMTSIQFTANTSYVNKDVSYHWYINGIENEDAKYCKTISVNNAKKSYTIQVKLVDSGGNIVAESEVETVKIKTSFWSRLIGFFRKLLGRLPVIAQSISRDI